MTAPDIPALLAQAHALEQAARQRRREAGVQLAILRDQTPSLEWGQAVRHLGIDPRTASLLIEMACGGREADR